MSMILARRIDALEKRIGMDTDPGPDPVIYGEWLGTLPDDDLEHMAGVAKHLETGGSLDDLSSETLKRTRAIMSTWETFGDAQS